MGSKRGRFGAFITLAGLFCAAVPAQAAPDTPCLELRLGGESMVRLPCPEGLAEILESPLFRPAPQVQEDFAIAPDIPDDRDMAVDPEWPHDDGMIAEPDGARPPQMRASTPAPPAP